MDLSPLSFKPDRFAVVLGHTLSSAVLAFDYNSAALSLCLRGRNRSCTLDGYDDQNNPTYIMCDGPDSTCVKPDQEAQWKFAWRHFFCCKCLGEATGKCDAGCAGHITDTRSQPAEALPPAGGSLFLLITPYYALLPGGAHSATKAISFLAKEGGN